MYFWSSEYWYLASMSKKSWEYAVGCSDLLMIDTEIEISREEAGRERERIRLVSLVLWFVIWSWICLAQHRRHSFPSWTVEWENFCLGYLLELQKSLLQGLATSQHRKDLTYWMHNRCQYCRSGFSKPRTADWVWTRHLCMTAIPRIILCLDNEVNLAASGVRRNIHCQRRYSASSGQLSNHQHNRSM